MTSPKLVALMALIAFIVLLICPSQSMPTDDQTAELPARHKRWTFNTWRLHGRRQLSKGLYSPKSAVALLPDGYQYQIYNDEGDLARRMQERLVQAFPGFSQT